MADDGLSTLVIKGFSLAVLYPQTELRECGDIDIYSGPDYEAVNACLARHGLPLGRADGHHIHIPIDGISVEHHFALHNARVKSGMRGPVEVLQQLAAKDKRPTALPGICFPNPAFTALFTGWHAHKHFLAEKIELRHVVDWALALRQLSADEARTLHEAKDESQWGRFTDTLTAIAIHRLHLPEEWFPQQELESAAAINPDLEQRTCNDIIGAPHTPHGRTKMQRRINIAHRMLQNRWKYKEYADMGAGIFLWKQFVGYVRDV